MENGREGERGEFERKRLYTGELTAERGKLGDAPVEEVPCSMRDEHPKFQGDLIFENRKNNIFVVMRIFTVKIGRTAGKLVGLRGGNEGTRRGGRSNRRRG